MTRASLQEGDPAAARPPGLSRDTRRVALIVSGTFFIEQLDTTIIATAVPDIARALNADPLQLNLAMTAYMLGLAIFVPVSGRLADRYGSRTIFAMSTSLFLVASLLCGLATHLEMLVAARFLQGIGGAMMAPVGRLIVLRTASRQEMVEAMAWVLMPAMVAPMVGPAIGGLIITFASWRWIFFVNLPLGALAIWYILREVKPESPVRTVRFDLVGTVLAGASFAAAALALELLTQSPSPWGALALLAAGIALFAGYVVHARRHPAPVLDLTLLRVASFRWAMAGGSLYRIGVGGLPFLLPVALQVAYGVSPLHSGLVVLLPAVGGFLMKFLTTRLLRRHGYRRILIVNGVISASLMCLLALARPGLSVIVCGVVLVALGFSRSLHMNAYGTLAYADVDKPRMASATSFFLSIQNFTVGLGVALSALAVRMAEAAAPSLAPWHHYGAAFAVMGACCAASVGISFFLRPEAGSGMLVAAEPARTNLVHANKFVGRGLSRE